MKSRWNSTLKMVLMMTTTMASSQVALAQSGSATKVGARAGMVDVDGLGSTLGMGAFGELPVTQSLSIRPSIDYWQKSSGEGAGIADVEVTVSDLTLGGAAKYSFQVSGMLVKPYVVGGLALHSVSAEVKASSPIYDSDLNYTSSDMELGFDLGGGIAYSMSKSMDLSGEFLLRNVDAADVMTITGGLSYAL